MVKNVGYDGQIQQSAHMIQPSDYKHERLYGLFKGIIMNVKISDDPTNSGYKNSDDKTRHRTGQMEATVLITHGSVNETWIVPNAAIVTGGLTGIDNYHEEIPRGTTQTIDGSALQEGLIDYNKLDGEQCIVQFIGGRIDQPVITHWYPHPRNTNDAATSGLNEGTLKQDPRYFKRYNGVKFIITNKGNTYIDTTEGNSKIIGKPEGPKRINNINGGDLQVNIKENSKFNINFNPPVNLPESEPSLPQPNDKSSPKIDGKRGELLTDFKMDKDFITAVAGKVVQILGKQAEDSVLLGEEPTDHIILGEKHQETYNTFVGLFNAFVNIYSNHIHLDSTGQVTTAPTGTPIPNPAFNPLVPPGPTNPISLPSPASAPSEADEMPDDDLSTIVKTQ